MRQIGLATIVVYGALVCVAGCGSDSEKNGSGGLAIVDLDQVARELGRDAKIKEAIGRKKDSLNQQLSALQSSLKAKYDQQQQEIDTPFSEDQTRRLQAQIAARLNQARRKAQNDLVAYRAELIAQFREDVKPVARKIARVRGLSIVVPKNDGFVLTFEPAVDITAEVAEQLKSNPPAPPPDRISDAGSNQKR